MTYLLLVDNQEGSIFLFRLYVIRYKNNRWKLAIEHQSHDHLRNNYREKSLMCTRVFVCICVSKKFSERKR